MEEVQVAAMPLGTVGSCKKYTADAIIADKCFERFNDEYMRH